MDMLQLGNYIKIGSELVASVVAMAVVSVFVFNYHLRPAWVTRRLRSSGYNVLPFKPPKGHMTEIFRLKENAQMSDLPSASAHHLLPARIHPFYTQILANQQGSKTVYWWGTSPRMIITDPEHVKYIMSSEFNNFSKAPGFRKTFSKLLGYGLLLTEGQDWHHRRAIFRPAFFAENLKAMVGDAYVSALELAASWQNKVKQSDGNSAEVEVATEFKKTTADILARTSFGTDYHSGRTVFENQDKLLELLISTDKGPIPMLNILKRYFKIFQITRAINKELTRIVNKRLASAQDVPPAAEPRTDLLSVMLEKDSSGRPKLAATQIVDECKTFFFAGHETTAHLLTWTMMLLALHSDWQEKLREEVLEVCGNDESPKAEQLHKLKLMTMVLNESLRLYPPVPEVTPRIQDNVANSPELNIKEMGYAIPLLLIQRDPLLWGQDADEFKPERFSAGASKASSHPSAFMPFGFGPRVCIGQNFALMEARIILVAILQRFRFSLSPNYKHAPVTMITMKPKFGMQIILKSIL